MLQKIRKSLKNKKGFSLVELIVVIAVLGILASVAVPKFSGMRAKAEQAVDQEAIITMNKMVEMYFVEKGKYPNTKDEVIEAIKLAFDSVPSPNDNVNKSFYYNKTNHNIEVGKKSITDTNLIELN